MSTQPASTLLKSIVQAARDMNICTKADFQELLKKHPGTTKITDLHAPVLWTFLVSRPWWTVELKDDADCAELTFMARVLRLALDARCVTQRELLRIVGSDRLATYLMNSPAVHRLPVLTTLKKLLAHITEEEYVSAEALFKHFDLTIFIRTIGLARMYTDILVPIAERLGWIQKNVPAVVITESTAEQPAAIIIEPQEKPSHALLALGLLQRRSSPALTAVDSVAAMYPSPTHPPPQSQVTRRPPKAK